jgi:hypothetical protein
MSVTFLTGPAGTGKTTRAVEQLRHLLAPECSAPFHSGVGATADAGQAVPVGTARPGFAGRRYR